jgi:hypothetical protein
VAGPGGVEAGRAYVVVVPDLSRFAKELKAQVERLERSLKLQIPTGLDVTEAEGDLARLRENAESREIELRASLESLRDEVRARVEEAERTAPTVRIRADVDRSQLGLLASMSGIVEGIGKRATEVLRILGGWTVSLGAAASLAVAIAPAVIQAGAAVAKYGSAALAAAPAVLSLATSVILVKKLFSGAISPALAKSMEPLTAGFKKLGEAAAKEATPGIRTLSAAVVKANLPALEPAMRRIGKATNGVVKQFLAWAKSAAGVQALRNIADSTRMLWGCWPSRWAVR